MDAARSGLTRYPEKAEAVDRASSCRVAGVTMMIRCVAWLRAVSAKQLDLFRAKRVIDEYRMPQPLRQQRLGCGNIGNATGLRAPALKSSGDQRCLDILRCYQHDRLI